MTESGEEMTTASADTKEVTTLAEDLMEITTEILDEEEVTTEDTTDDTTEGSADETTEGSTNDTTEGSTDDATGGSTDDTTEGSSDDTTKGSAEDTFYADALQAQLAVGDPEVLLDIQKLMLNHMAGSTIYQVDFELEDLLPTATKPPVDPYYAEALQAQLTAGSDEEKLKIMKQMVNYMAGYTVFLVDEDLETTTEIMDEMETTEASMEQTEAVTDETDLTTEATEAVNDETDLTTEATEAVTDETDLATEAIEAVTDEAFTVSIEEDITAEIIEAVTVVGVVEDSEDAVMAEAAIELTTDTFVETIMTETGEETTAATTTTEETTEVDQEMSTEGSTTDSFLAQALQAQLASGLPQVKLNIQKLILNYIAGTAVFPVDLKLQDLPSDPMDPTVDLYYAEALQAMITAASDEEKQTILKEMLNHMAGYTVFPVDEGQETTTDSVIEDTTTVNVVFEEAMDDFLDALMPEATMMTELSQESTTLPIELTQDVNTVPAETGLVDSFYEAVLNAQLEVSTDEEKLNIQKFMLNYLAGSEVFPVNRDLLPPALLLL